MNSDTKTSNSDFSCPNCSVGFRRLQHITYFTWLQNHLITVPNFPAWICDICGAREFDAHAISWIKAMLNPPSKKHSFSRQGLENNLETTHEKDTAGYGEPLL